MVYGEIVALEELVDEVDRKTYRIIVICQNQPLLRLGNCKIKMSN